MKVIRLKIAIISLFFVNSSLAEQDFKIDPETSLAIPIFIGKVIFSKGRLSKTKLDGSIVSIGKGSRFFEGEGVFTKKRSIAKIKMVDDTVISLGPNSELNFEKFKFKSKKNRKSVYKFLKGKLRAHFPNKARPGDLSVETPTYSMGIRGTKILANIHKRKNGKIITQFALLTGKIVLANRETDKKHIVNRGDHFISQTGKNIKTQELTRELSEKQYQSLLAKDQDELKKFNPLLHFFKGESPILEKRKKRVLKAKNKTRRSLSPVIKGNSKYINNKDPRTWKSMVKELNNRLEENNFDD